eukprot:COSAG02_NODE_36_length_48934_cov_144.851029_33_plen_69_part_00
MQRRFAVVPHDEVSATAASLACLLTTTATDSTVQADETYMKEQQRIANKYAIELDTSWRGRSDRMPTA